MIASFAKSKIFFFLFPIVLVGMVGLGYGISWSPSRQNPEPRSFPALGVLADNQLVVADGWNGENWFRDEWHFHPQRHQWSQRPANNKDTGREGMAFAPLPTGEGLLLFGGCRGKVHFGDFGWLSQIGLQFFRLGGAPPSRRCNASLISLDNGTYVLGCGFNYEQGYLGDWYFVDLPHGQSKEILTPTFPPKRYGQVAVFDQRRNRILLFGGFAWSDGFGDLWELSLTTWTWKQLEPPGEGPSARWFASGVIDPGRDRLVLFGGYDGKRALKELWELDLARLRWERRPSESGPCGRTGHAMAWSPGTGAILFGGRDDKNQYLADGWVWDGNDWKEWSKKH